MPTRKIKSGINSSIKSLAALAGAPVTAALIACAVPGDAANATALTTPAECGRSEHTNILLVLYRCGVWAKFIHRYDYSMASPVADLGGRELPPDDVVGSIPLSSLDAPPPKPFQHAALPPMPLPETANTPGGEPAPTMIVGAASMYDPTDPSDRDSGDGETASGETYDPLGWTAAIKIDFRDRFGGVRYRMKYEATYALVESGEKRLVVRINDVGPLKPGRIIDLNRRAMQFFDPTLTRGLIAGVRVTPLTGRHWAVGPVEDTDSAPTTVAAR